MLVSVKDKFTHKSIRSFESDSGSLVDIVKQYYPEYQPRVKAPLTVAVNGGIVIQSVFASTEVREPDEVVILREPKDPVSLLINFAVTASVNYLVSEFFTPEPDNYQTSASGASVYQASNRTNSPRLGSPPGEIFGTFYNVPDLISAPFLYYENNTQYRCMLLGCGVGQYDFLSTKIADTDISRLTGIDQTIFQPGDDVSSHVAHRHIYTSAEVGGTSASSGLLLESGGYISASNPMASDVLYNFSADQITAYKEVDDGAGGTTPTPENWPYAVDDFISVVSDFNSGTYKITAVAADVITVVNDIDESVSFSGTSAITAEIDELTETPEGDWLGPFLACPEGTTTTNGEVDLFYPGGIGKETPDGTIEYRTVTTEIQWREVGETAWTSIVVTRTERTRDDQAQTVPINFGSYITPEVRMRRTSASSDANTVRDTVQWQYLKSELPTVTTYDRITVMAIRIKIDGGISSSATNLITTTQQRKLSIWNATTEEWSEPAATNDIAPAFAYIVKNSGHPDSVLQLDKLDELHTIWSGRGDEVNGAVDTATTVFPLLSRILQPGYSDLYLAGGQVNIVRDAAQTAFGQFFSETNTFSIAEIGSMPAYNEYDGVRVEYVDPDTNLPAYIDCVLDGKTGDSLQSLRLLFCTSELAAYRWGMRQASKLEYVTTRFEVNTEMEGLNVQKGSMCAVMGHEAQAGVCHGYDAALRVLTIDDELQTDGEEVYYVGLRKRDGRVSGPYLCEVVSGFIQITDEAELDFTPIFDEPEDPPFYLFGTQDNWMTPALAQKITGGDGSTLVTLDQYDERVYLYDDAALPV